METKSGFMSFTPQKMHKEEFLLQLNIKSFNSFVESIALSSTLTQY